MNKRFLRTVLAALIGGMLMTPAFAERGDGRMKSSGGDSFKRSSESSHRSGSAGRHRNDNPTGPIVPPRGGNNHPKHSDGKHHKRHHWNRHHWDWWHTAQPNRCFYGYYRDRHGFWHCRDPLVLN